MSDPPPRIRPGSRAEIGALNALIVWLIARATGTEEPPHLFTTLARNRRLFRAWLLFAGALMPRGMLPREDTELVILRVATNCRCDYEWRHHERLAARAGLTPQAVGRVIDGPQAPGWTARQRLLLSAADELHERRELPGELWRALRRELGEPELIELCLLIGHYELLAMFINTVRIERDAAHAASSRRAGWLRSSRSG